MASAAKATCVCWERAWLTVLERPSRRECRPHRWGDRVHPATPSQAKGRRPPSPKPLAESQEQAGRGRSAQAPQATRPLPTGCCLSVHVSHPAVTLPWGPAGDADPGSEASQEPVHPTQTPGDCRGEGSRLGRGWDPGGVRDAAAGGRGCAGGEQAHRGAAGRPPGASARPALAPAGSERLRAAVPCLWGARPG